MKYAIVEKGVVTNIAVADAPIAPNWVESDTACIGWLQNEDGTLSAPHEVAPAVVIQPWTKKEFLLKFTPSEYAGIAAATKTNAMLDYYWQLFMVADNVLKTDPATVAGINALEANGLLASGRAAEILA